MEKKIFLLFLSAWVVLLISCEDAGFSKGDKNFLKTGLQTVYVDTFAVTTSTILIDSLPTSGNGVLLIGNYHDPFLGKVSASTYFQIGYQTAFLPDQNSTFDSIGLILPYSKYSYGDSTKSQTISVHQMTSLPTLRRPPIYRTDENISYFVAASRASLYNASSVSFNPTPITSVNVKFFPHRDSLYIPFPKAFGQNWFNIAQSDVAALKTNGYFSNPNSFLIELFNGIHITSDGTSNASIAGFKTTKAKVRIYYRKLLGDKQVYFDLPLGSADFQFNSIKGDRTGTMLSTLGRRQSIPSSATGNASFIQSGIGLATKIEFPTLKGFFTNKNYTIIDAALEITPVLNTYPTSLKAPSILAIYLTDNSNVVLNKAAAFDRSGFLSANIVYDYEYGIKTKYSFPLINFLSSELKSTSNIITPLVIAAPPPFALTETNRVILHNQTTFPQNRIKLKIYYSYVPNQ
jgi:Domain of unknown function (DUF4270)